MSPPLTDEQRQSLKRRILKAWDDNLTHPADVAVDIKQAQLAVDALSDLLAAGLRVTGPRPDWWPREEALEAVLNPTPPVTEYVRAAQPYARALRWYQKGES